MPDPLIDPPASDSSPWPSPPVVISPLESPSREEAAEPPAPRPQPGLANAVLIAVAVVLVHLVATMLYVVSFRPEMMAGHVPTPEELFRLLAFDQALFVLIVYGMTWWAFGSRFTQRIPFSWPPLRHAGLIVLLVLPLAVMDGFLAQTVIQGWEAAFGASPSQGDLPDVLRGVTRESSTGFLLLILAVAPALGEELVFRGVIGRGLIARHGVVSGVLLTSLLFSLVHGNPVQAVGVFPVGVMAHLAYLSTRTLAAPILLHFLNNALPVLALKNLAAQSAADSSAAMQQMAIRPELALAAACCVAIFAVLLWQTRVEPVGPNGDVLPSSVPTVESPSGSEFAVLRCRKAAPSWVVLAGLSYLAFLLSGSLVTPS